MLSSVGLPGLNGFIGEYLTLMGAFTSPVLNSWSYAILSSTGVILAAVYLLWMYQRFMMGPVTHEENRKLTDLTNREMVSLIPLVVMMVWIGMQPMHFLKTTEDSVNKMSDGLIRLKTGAVAAPSTNPYQLVDPKVQVK